VHATRPAHPTAHAHGAGHPPTSPAHPPPASSCGGGHEIAHGSTALAAHHGHDALAHTAHGGAAELHATATVPGPTPGALALEGAGRAAIIAAAVSGMKNASAASRGEKTTSDAAIDTAIDTAAAAASGAAIGAASGVARGVFQGVGLGILTRTAAPVAFGLTAVDVGRDALALSRKGMDPRRFKERIVVHVFRGGTTWAGLELGAALGSLAFPGIGTTLGAIAGGVLGYRVGTWLAEERPEDAPAGS